MRSMKRLLTILLLSLAASPLGAQTLETAARAYARGDLKGAWQQWWTLAHRGDAAAQYQVGLLYGSGIGVPTDHAEAAGWYLKAARQGHDRAQAALGLLYSTGMGVPLDQGEAVRWYREAARRGNRDAQFNLGLSSWNGDGTTQDFDAAARQFRETAPAGSAYGRTVLGTLSTGGGQTASAAPDLPPAPPALVQESTALGPPYGTPTGPPLAPVQLFQYHHALAQRGDTRSQSQIGYMYGTGYGTRPNLIEAHKWSNIAAARLGPSPLREYAIHNRNAAAVLMTPEQVLRAQALARAWVDGFKEPALK